MPHGAPGSRRPAPDCCAPAALQTPPTKQPHHQPHYSISQLERPVPITVALLAVNIVAHYLLEVFLPVGINLVEIGAICLQPARIAKLVMVPPSSSYGGGGWDEWLAGLMSLGTTPSTRGFSASTAARWQEAASRVWLSAFVHGDELHLYWNMMSLLYKGVKLEIGMGSLVRLFCVCELLPVVRPRLSSRRPQQPYWTTTRMHPTTRSPSSASSSSPGSSPTRSSCCPRWRSTPVATTAATTPALWASARSSSQ